MTGFTLTRTPDYKHPVQRKIVHKNKLSYLVMNIRK